MNNQIFSTRDSEIKLFVILAIVLTLLLLTSFIFGSKAQRKDNSVPTETASRSFEQIAIKAKAVYVYDVRTKSVLFTKNENTRLPLASLTKIMAAVVAQDINPLYSVIMVGDEALLTEGDNGLMEGERWSLKNLLDFSMVSSSNDGMHAVALSLGALSRAGASSEEIINDFVGEMNRKAGKLGLKNTYFWNETGLDLPASKVGEADIKGGAYGTAKDMSVLMEHALINYPEMFDATTQRTATLWSLDNRSHVARNTNHIVDEIPGLLASKTGLTDTAGGNLIFAFDPELGRPIIVSVLGSTETGRFTDARVLVKAIMEHIKNN